MFAHLKKNTRTFNETRDISVPPLKVEFLQKVHKDIATVIHINLIGLIQVF